MPQGNLDTPPAALIIDDDPPVQEAVAALLRFSGFETEVFASANAFLSSRRREGPCCLILDMNLPDLNGLDLQALVSSGSDGIPIVFITGYGDIPTAVRAMKAGAIDLLNKPFTSESLLAATRCALERSRNAILEERVWRILRDRYSSLSRREKEVMSRVVSGFANKVVAVDLGISEITVKAHRGRVMRKMAAASLPDLVNMNAVILSLSE